MFSGSGYTTKQLRRLPDVWISCKLNMASVNWQFICAIFDSSRIRTSGSLCSSLELLSNPEYMSIAVGISLLSCIKGDIYVRSILLPTMAAIFDFRFAQTSDSISTGLTELLTPKTWVYPLEFRSYVVYKQRYEHSRFEGCHFGFHTSD